MPETMRDTAVLHRVKQGYTTGARSLASRSVVGLARTRITPNALTFNYRSYFDGLRAWRPSDKCARMIQKRASAPVRRRLSAACSGCSRSQASAARKFG